MRLSKFINIFTDRHPLAGPVCWMLSAQFFVMQLIVARAWANPSYSLTRNTISDLGVTTCGTYRSQFVHNQLVCSPLHAWMNVSLLVLGATMVIGATLIYQEFRGRRGSAVGFGCMALAGFGTVMVGLFPENTLSSLHIIGAGLPFLIGNIGLVVLGMSLGLPRLLRVYTILSGLIMLIALALLLSNHYMGLGIGGMERITAYPQTAWFIVFGAYMMNRHLCPKTSDPVEGAV
jgi:hypothetical membrane protein